MLRNRAFQGSSSDGVASLARNTNYWHPVGGVSLAIDTSSPAISSTLPYQMRMDVPVGTTGTVGFYNEGFWGFDVNANKRYIASLYMRGNYSGTVDCYFHSNSTGQILGSTSMNINQASSSGWVQSYSATFQPSKTGFDGNNTFYFKFDGSKLAGKSVYFNILSLFKQTLDNRSNGVREDLADALLNMHQKYIRLPGGNNMEGSNSLHEWKWNETIGSLKNRPGRPGTWGDINTDGFGLLEMMQMAQDLDLEVILGIWAGLYLDGEVISQAKLQPYVDSVMNELEFLLVSWIPHMACYERETSADGTREINRPRTGLSALPWDSLPLLPSSGLRLAMKTTSTVEPTHTIRTDTWPSTTPSMLSIRPSILSQPSTQTQSHPMVARWTFISTATKTISCLFSTLLTKLAANTRSSSTSTQRRTSALITMAR